MEAEEASTPAHPQPRSACPPTGPPRRSAVAAASSRHLEPTTRPLSVPSRMSSQCSTHCAETKPLMSGMVAIEPQLRDDSSHGTQRRPKRSGHRPIPITRPLPRPTVGQPTLSHARLDLRQGTLHSPVHTLPGFDGAKASPPPLVPPIPDGRLRGRHPFRRCFAWPSPSLNPALSTERRQPCL